MKPLSAEMTKDKDVLLVRCAQCKFIRWCEINEPIKHSNCPNCDHDMIQIGVKK